MGLEEFEKNLEKKIEQERETERQRMLRELKTKKVIENLQVAQNEKKRVKKVESKMAEKDEDEEESLKKWRSAPLDDQNLKNMLLKKKNK